MEPPILYVLTITKSDNLKVGKSELFEKDQTHVIRINSYRKQE